MKRFWGVSDLWVLDVVLEHPREGEEAEPGQEGPVLTRVQLPLHVLPLNHHRPQHHQQEHSQGHCVGQGCFMHRPKRFCLVS
jgi:hypothetical protein